MTCQRSHHRSPGGKAKPGSPAYKALLLSLGPLATELIESEVTFGQFCKHGNTFNRVSLGLVIQINLIRQICPL